MRSTCNRSLWIILLLISIQCVSVAKQEFFNVQQRENQVVNVQNVKRPADIASQWSIEQRKLLLPNEIHSKENVLPLQDDNNNNIQLTNILKQIKQQQQTQKQQQQQDQKKQRQKNTTECAKSSLETNTNSNNKNLEILPISTILKPVQDMTTKTSTNLPSSSSSLTIYPLSSSSLSSTLLSTRLSRTSTSTLNAPFDLYSAHFSQLNISVPAAAKKIAEKQQQEHHVKELLKKSSTIDGEFHSSPNIKSIFNNKKMKRIRTNNQKKKKGKLDVLKNRQILHVAYTNRHQMYRDRLSTKSYIHNQNNKNNNNNAKKKFNNGVHGHVKRETAAKKNNNLAINKKKNNREIGIAKQIQTMKQVNSDNALKQPSSIEQSRRSNEQTTYPFSQPYVGFNNESNSAYTSTLDSMWSMPFVWNAAAKSPTDVSLSSTEEAHKPKEPIIIIDDVEEFDSGTMNNIPNISNNNNNNNQNHNNNNNGSDDYGHLEPRAFPLRPLIPSPFDNEEISVVYADQHTEIRLMCEVDLDIASSTWYKNGQVVHAIDRTSRATDYRFIKEPNGALTITNVMLEDDGKWQCEAENTRRYSENARPVKLVVLDPPKAPYLLIDSRRLDAGNIFVPVKENSELNLACISEGGNPKPTLSWEVLLSPGIDRHTQKVAAEVLELQEIKTEKETMGQRSTSGTKSEARLPAVYRAHHNARILCVMEHPTLKVRQNASLLLDVQYTPSFAISRTPGFGYPLREGMEVSLKCDVDSNPPSTPQWQKDDNETPVPQNGDGFLNFTSIRREHSGWYKCTSRHLNFQYSSIGYYLSVRFDSVEVTSEPDDQDVSVAAASHNPNKGGQLEVQLGGTVTLQCPQGSLGCWSHLDPVTARLRGLGQGLSSPTGHFSIKDVVYQDAGTYKCVGQSATNKKKFEVLQTVGVAVKGAPTVTARDAAPVAYPGSPLHLAVEFCANPPAHAARWLHGDRVFTPGNQYGSSVLAYGVMDLPTPFCKEARLTYVSMHERVERVFYFIVSTPGGVAEAMFRVNFTKRFRKLTNSNAGDDEQEKLSEPEEIHFPVFGVKSMATMFTTEALYCQLTFVIFAKLISFLKM